MQNPRAMLGARRRELPEVEKSLITDEHRATIGVKSEGHKVVVSGDDARRMRDLLGDTDPRYQDGTGIAPPYVLAAIDPGIPRHMMPRVLPGGLLTQMEWKFHRPFRIGEELILEHSVIDIRDRLGGRYGYSVIVMIQSSYTGKDGDLVAESLRTLTQFDPGSAKDNT